MSEPKAQARRILPLGRGVYRWQVRDERIGGVESDAYAVESDEGLVLIDPLPVPASALERIGEPCAIVLTAANHQRSAWRLREAFAIPVYAPAGPRIGSVPGQLEQRPDRRYRHGDPLPGGLVAFHTPGPAIAMYSLWHPESRTLFVSDLLTRGPRGGLRFVPSEYQDDPARTRESVRQLLASFRARTLCLSHGPPVEQPRKEMERALADDGVLA